jgi:hypothetical protein
LKTIQSKKFKYHIYRASTLLKQLMYL